MAEVFYNCLYGETYMRFINEAVKRSDIISIEIHWHPDDFNFRDKKECLDNGYFTEEQYDSIYKTLKKNWMDYKTVFENRTVPYLKKLEPFLLAGQSFESKSLNYYLSPDPKIIPLLLEPGSINTWGDPFYPDDLEFITNNKSWFFCENHECSATLFPDSYEDYEFWERIGIVFRDSFDHGRDVENRPIAEYFEKK